MDPKSHINFGMKPQKIVDGNYNFSEIEHSKTDSSVSYGYSSLTQNQPSGSREYPNLSSKNEWKSENVECKQEVDSLHFMHNLNCNDNSNYGSESEFNEPYQYEYNQISSRYPNEMSSSTISQPEHYKFSSLHQHRMGPYQLTSTKNQLPSWYNPPNNCYPPAQAQSGYLQQTHPYHQGNLLGEQAASVDHSMRNMIHLTSRYNAYY